MHGTPIVFHINLMLYVVYYNSPSFSITFDKKITNTQNLHCKHVYISITFCHAVQRFTFLLYHLFYLYASKIFLVFQMLLSIVRYQTYICTKKDGYAHFLRISVPILHFCLKAKYFVKYTRRPAGYSDRPSKSKAHPYNTFHSRRLYG